jgi:MFS family permease
LERTAVDRLENLRTLKWANLDVAFSTSFATLFTGTFLVAFIQFIGGGDGWIQLLAGIPMFAGILQLVGGAWGRGFGNYKNFVTPGGAAWRLLHVPIVFLPLAAFSGEAKLIILASCVAIASAAVMIVQPIYNDWLAEIIPASSRGWYFSRRNAIAGTVGALVGLAGGFALDQFRSFQREELGFTVIFAVGIVCAAISFYFYMKMPSLDRPNPIRESLANTVRSLYGVVRDRSYAPVLLFLSFFVFAQQFGGLLFTAFAIESLNMPFGLIQLSVIGHAAGGLLAAAFWGRLSDRYGNKPILLLLGFMLSLTPIMWLFCQPDQNLLNTVILVVGHVFSGAVWAGVAMTQFNLLLATARPEDRANYLGVALAVQSIVGGLAPLAGAALMAVLRVQIADVTVAYKFLFVAVCVLRFLAAFTLIPVQELGSHGLRRTVRHLSKISPSGLAALGRLNKATSPDAKIEALQTLAGKRMLMASPEIQRALRDPVPKVRRQAALSLGELKDPAAAEALIELVDHYPELVEEETIWALGATGGEKAILPLEHMLSSPRALIRRSAARALARIGSKNAVPALRKAALADGDPDLRRAALQALRMLDAREAEPEILIGLQDEFPGVQVAAAEAAGEFEVRAAADVLRTRIPEAGEGIRGEMIYALGAVGEQEDLALLLSESHSIHTAFSRQRALLGVARLLGAEMEAYRLLALEQFERDRLLGELSGARSSHPSVKAALQNYSKGMEFDALQEIAKHPALSMSVDWEEWYCDDLFLVLFAVVLKGKTSG